MAASKYSAPLEYPLFGKVAIVTGATSGIGRVLFLELFRMGSSVVIASRSMTKCLKVLSWFIDFCGIMSCLGCKSDQC